MAGIYKPSNSHTPVATGWTNPENAYDTVGDNVYATGSPGKNSTLSGDFGFPDFTSADIPDGSSINAVQVVAETVMSAVVTGGTVGIQGRLGGSNSGSEGIYTTDTTERQVSCTLSGVTLADLRSASTNITARVRASKGSTNSALTVSVDFVYIFVNYTAPSGTTQNAAAAIVGTAAASGAAMSWAAAGADAFGRTEVDGWGNADAGGPWSVLSGAAADFDVNGGTGKMLLGSTGSTHFASLPVLLADPDVLVRFKTDKLAAGSSQHVSLGLRMQDALAADYYQFRVVLSTSAGVTLDALRVVTALGTTTVASQAVARETHAAGVFFWLRAQVQGSNPQTLRAKIWRDGTSEPGWDIDTTDTSAPLAGAGGVGLRTFLLSGASNLPVLFEFDDLSATVISTGVTRDAAAAIAGSATASAAGTFNPATGAASISGTAATSGAAVAIRRVSSSAAGAGTASAVAGLRYGAAASAGGAAQAQATGGLILAAAAVVAVAASVSAGARLTLAVASSVTGTASVAPGAGLRTPGAASVVGSATVALSGYLLQASAAAAAGSATTTADPVLIRGVASAVSATAQTLSSPVLILGASGGASGIASAAAGGGYLHLLSAALTGTAITTGAAGKRMQVASSIVGSANAQVSGALTIQGGASVSGTASASAFGSVTGSSAAAAVSGTLTATGSASMVLAGAAASIGIAATSAGATQIRGAAASATGTATSAAGAGIQTGAAGAAVGAVSVTSGATRYARVGAGASGTAAALGGAILVVPGQAEAVGVALVEATAALWTGPVGPRDTVGLIRLVPQSVIPTLTRDYRTGTIRVRPGAVGGLAVKEH